MKKGKFLLLLASGLVVSLIAIYAFTKPSYNWDLFPYLALTIESPEKPFDSIHQATYQLASEQMPLDDFNAVSARQAGLRGNPKAFEEILGFFRIKKGFIATIRSIHSLGLNPVVATYILSPISYCLLGWLVAFWISRYLDPIAAAVTTVSVMLLPVLLQTSRYSSPDLPSALLLLTGTACILDSRSGIGLFFGAASITFRPDAVIYVEMMVIALLISKTYSWPAALSATFGLVVMTWWLLPGPSFLMQFLITSADYSPAWNASTKWANYRTSLLSGLSTLGSLTLVSSFLAGIASLYIISRVRSIRHDLMSLLVIGLMASLVIRYLMHPIIEDRFLIATYLIWILGFLRSLSEIRVIKSRLV